MIFFTDTEAIAKAEGGEGASGGELLALLRGYVQQHSQPDDFYGNDGKLKTGKEPKIFDQTTLHALGELRIAGRGYPETIAISSLYVTYEYERLRKLIIERKVTKVPTTGTSIVGSPGIGKSVMLMYMLWWLVQHENDSAIKGTRVEVFTRKMELTQPSATAPYIFTLGTDGSNNGKVLELYDHEERISTTDPGRVNFMSIGKTAELRKGGEKLYMDSLKVNELIEMKKWAFANAVFLSDDDIRDRYSVVGGKARLVFEKAEDGLTFQETMFNRMFNAAKDIPHGDLGDLKRMVRGDIMEGPLTGAGFLILQKDCSTRPTNTNTLFELRHNPQYPSAAIAKFASRHAHVILMLAWTDTKRNILEELTHQHPCTAPLYKEVSFA